MGQLTSKLKIVERCSPSSLQRLASGERKPRNWERASPRDWEQLDLRVAHHHARHHAQHHERSYAGYEGISPNEEFHFAPMESFRQKNGEEAGADDDMPEYEQAMDIPEDCYGATMMTVVKEMAEISDHGMSLLNFVRACYVGGLMLLNLTLQVGFLVSIHLNIVQTSVWRVQSLFRGFRGELFDVRGAFDQKTWTDDWPLKEDICQLAFTSDVFLYTVVLLWTFTMLAEFRQAQTYVMNIQRMPTCEKGCDMLMKDGSSTSIIALTWPTRAMVYIFVVAPKLFVSACLLWLGTRWLTSATSFEDLVMNAVAMEFVCGIDNLLYNVILPTFFHHEVEDIDFCVLKTARGDVEETQRDQIAKIIKSCLVVACAMVFPILWIFFLQDVLPNEVDDIKEHCASFLSERVPFCAWTAIRGGTSTCFPYGENDHQVSETLDEAE